MAASVNKYHLKLDIPKPFTFPNYQVPDKHSKYHTRFLKRDMNKEFVSWLHSLNINVVAGEFFYTPPHGILEPHSDTRQITDVVKLNWMIGGVDSVMDWYELKPGTVLQTSKTGIGTEYSYARKEDLELVHSASIGTPSLVNVGRIHSVCNKGFPRYVACVVLGNPITQQRLSWDEAINIFKDYVV